MDCADLQIKMLVADELGIGYGVVSASARLMDDLGADSVDIAFLLVTLEEQFGAEVPDDAIDRELTVQDLLSYVNSKSTTPFFHDSLCKVNAR